MSAITVTIEDADLWSQFSGMLNEMIVMKKGRSLFPLLSYRVNGLVPECNYAMKLHMEAVDNTRYRLDQGTWTYSLRADAITNNKEVYHPDGAKNGADWMKFPIGFKNVKLSNNMETDQPMHIPLQTMRKYMPVLTIMEVRTNQLTGQLKIMGQQRFRLPYTEFIAVTAYQNKGVIALKTANNKYAKRFRESSKKRKRVVTPEDPESEADKVPEPAAKRVPLIETTNQPPTPPMDQYNNYYQQKQYCGPEYWNPQYQQNCEWPSYENQYQQQSYYYPPQEQHNQYWNGF